jgi:hypothetical protein
LKIFIPFQAELGPKIPHRYGVNRDNAEHNDSLLAFYVAYKQIVNYLTAITSQHLTRLFVLTSGVQTHIFYICIGFLNLHLLYAYLPLGAVTIVFLWRKYQLPSLALTVYLI